MLLVGLLLLACTLAGCSHHYHPRHTSVSFSSVEDPAESPAVDSIIMPYRQQFEAEMNEVIATAAVTLKMYKPESPLGNWVADAIKVQADKKLGTQLDFAIQNSGGLRIPEVAEGDVTVGKLYELMPFDNLITVMELDGRGILKLFDHMAADGGWPVSREVVYQIDGRNAKGVLISGEPVDPDGTYVFALPDYIANGGSDSGFLSEIAISRNDLDLLVRDALIMEAEATTGRSELLNGAMEGRVTRIN